MPMNMNPMQLIQMIKGGQNPQQLVMNILEQQMQNTPMGANLLSLAKLELALMIQRKSILITNFLSKKLKKFYAMK